MRLIFATGNEGKMREIRAIMADVCPQILSLKEAGLKAEAEENGASFAENAQIKAMEIHDKLKAEAQKAGRPLDALVLADDSGLCIDALEGAPGILSARWMGHDASYEEKNRVLIEKLADVPEAQRGAQFVCSICAVLPGGQVLHTEGVMPGKIAHAPAGAGGFGYDPIFYLPEYGMTSAELSAEEKNRISHRGLALSRMKERLISEGIFA
ncbi:MAG: RdgB/HAM1 family non-canonical purine NTP pyrophosphatase [Eubacteriales bacterium]|nr:RdgB/HAM1 family non-canonical purine NTP pyrophosphatase [Eubacteriales bacterium]